MEPYLIVLDLDGTLMLSFDKYDEETFSYLRNLSNDGHIIVLATGRPMRSSYFVYQALNLKTPLINYNGARVANPVDSKYPVTDLRISRKDLLDIIEHIRPSLINVFCEIIEDIYVQDYNEDIHPFLHTDGGVLHSGELKDILPGDPNGALFFLKKDAISDFEEYIKNNYSDTLLSRFWEVDENYIVEIYNPLVDKSVGVKDIMNYYNIPFERTMAFGDGHNDIGLFNAVKTSVAMKNSHPSLFEHATNTTDSNLEQGVLKFLKNYFK